MIKILGLLLLMVGCSEPCVQAVRAPEKTVIKETTTQYEPEIGEVVRIGKCTGVYDGYLTSFRETMTVVYVICPVGKKHTSLQRVKFPHKENVSKASKEDVDIYNKTLDYMLSKKEKSND